MGDYNADPVPNVPQAGVLANDYNFLPGYETRFDEWNIDQTTRVTAFFSGDGIVAVRFKTDPTVYPI